MLKNWMKTILLIVFCAFLDMSVANAETISCNYYKETSYGVEYINISFNGGNIDSLVVKNSVMGSTGGAIPTETGSYDKNELVSDLNIQSTSDCPKTISFSSNTVKSGGDYQLNLSSSSVEHYNYDSQDYISCGNGMISDISAKVPSITRTIYFVIELLVPIILVIIGSIDLVKGIIGGNDDEIKKGQKTFIKRLVTACIVFFILALVKLVVSVFGSTNKDNIINCMDCFLNSKDSCTQMVIDEERDSL